MTSRSGEILQPASENILYQTEDGRNKIEVRLENETVWLMQQLMMLDEPSRLVATRRDASFTIGAEGDDDR